MTVDSVTSPELLAAELAAIEDLLQNYEDWRAWAQLEVRERQGELPPAVAASGLKTLLLDKLANNSLFLRRQALVKQLEHVTAQARARPRNADEADDLTRIRGIDVRLERRLNNLAVRNWTQIAHWTPADVHYFASTLGLGDLIARDMWIEQAAALSGLAPRQPATAPLVQHQQVPPAQHVLQASVPPVQVPLAAPAVPPISAAPQAVSLPDPEVAPPASAPAAPTQEAVRQPSKGPALAVPPKPAAVPQAPAPAVTSQSASANPPAAAQAATPAQAKAGPTEPPPTPAVAKPVPVEDGAADTDAASAQPMPAPQPEYPVGEPARPLPAAVYAGYVPRPPSAALLERSVGPLKSAQLVAGVAPPHAPEPDYSALEPPAGAPAWYYEGAPVEPPHDLPGIARIPLPAPASVYAGAATVLETSHAAEAQPADPSEEDAGEVLQTELPPLPLQPAKPAARTELPPVAPQGPAASPVDVDRTGAHARVAPPGLPAAAALAPVPTSAQMATIAAAAAAAAASALGGNAAVAKGPAQQSSANEARTAPLVPSEAGVQPPRAQPAMPVPASSNSPEDLLRAATARAQQASSGPAAVPPPLPPIASTPTPAAASPATALPQPRQAQRPPLPPVSPRSVVIDEDEPGRGATAEARVTIRRADDGPMPPVIRNPGGADVHLSRQTPDRFDGDSYAAYHAEIEEAAVQIVKKPAHGAAASRRAVPPLLSSPVQPDPAAGARAAAEAAARAAAALNAQSQAARASVTSPPPPHSSPAAEEQGAPAPNDPAQMVKKGAEKAAVTMGRFLKALTGQ